ncbi:MAG: YhbY family RNA-binding protein [Lachnospiraceae bacterium]|nr:YhbY family RNA-binding protein [Lachnospiraceae bacterium]MBR1524256.1 YhbY family RNA-binding protein [Lachnospiraceae bacterium]
MDPIYQIGKESLTTEIVKGLDDALEARELIKVSVQKNCEDDVRSIADTAAERTRSAAVQVIGRKFVLYRPAKKPKIELPK